MKLGLSDPRLSVGGWVLLLAVPTWVYAQELHWTVVHLGLCLTAGLLISAGWAPARYRTHALSLALVCGLFGYLSWTWAYTVMPFPFIDMIRPWGMDKGPYPIFRPMLGFLLLAAGLPGAFGANGLRSWVLWGLSVGGLGVALSFWSLPQWYEMDMIEAADVYPDMPFFLPKPGWTGEGETPVILGGQLQHVHWTEYSYNALPLKALPFVARREEVLARLAWGMQVEIEQSLDKHSGSVVESLRATCWTLQMLLSKTYLYMQATLLPMFWILVLIPWHIARLDRFFVGLARALVWMIPLGNLLLLGLGIFLPEVQSTLPFALISTLGLSLAVALVDYTGRCLSREQP